MESHKTIENLDTSIAFLWLDHIFEKKIRLKFLSRSKETKKTQIFVRWKRK